MTRRGGNEASERRSGIEEDKMQPVIVQLAARWRRSNLVKLVRRSNLVKPIQKGVRKIQNLI